MSTIKPPISVSRSLRTIRDLTLAQRWLLRIMSEYQFGRIENLRVERGQPAPDRRLSIIRATRFGSKDGGPKVPIAHDPELKHEVWDLFDEIEQLQDGHVVRLEFKHGLPFQLETSASVHLNSEPSVPGGPAASEKEEGD